MAPDVRATRAVLQKKLRTARALLREEGAGAVAYRGAVRAAEAVLRAQVFVPPKRVAPIALLDLADVLAAERRAVEVRTSRRPAGPPFTVTWVLPPISRGSGGHSNIIRFVRYLEAAGHRCRLAFYDPHGQQTVEQARNILQTDFRPPVAAEVQQGMAGVEQSDFVIATSWQTAYPVAALPDGPQLMYFVQDFEPLFHPLGGDYVLAERTYSFGFHGITAGRWLKTKLEAEYGMPCEQYEFGSDFEFYASAPPAPRQSVFFYARPVTPRRGFELGVVALAMFAERHPEITIELAGWDTSRYSLPFPYINHGVLSFAELPALYRRCVAGLVLSFTNMSLLPLEILAAGCIPVINEGQNNRMVVDNPHVVYAPARAADLAGALTAVVEDPERDEKAAAAAESVREHGWDAAGRELETALLRLADG